MAKLLPIILTLVVTWASVAGARIAHADAETFIDQTPSELQKRIDAAEEGDVIEVGPGEHLGPIRIDRAIVLRGAGGS